MRGKGEITNFVWISHPPIVMPFSRDIERANSVRHSNSV